MLGPDQEEMKALEERLGSWVPSAGSLDRERMLFLAGRASSLDARRFVNRSRVWRLSTAAAILLAALMGLAWQHDRQRIRSLEEIILAQDSKPAGRLEIQLEPEPVPKNNNQPIDPTSYLGLVRQLKMQSMNGGPIEFATTPASRSSGPTSSVPAPEPLRPRDLDRVISL